MSLRVDLQTAKVAAPPVPPLLLQFARRDADCSDTRCASCDRESEREEREGGRLEGTDRQLDMDFTI